MHREAEFVYNIIKDRGYTSGAEIGVCRADFSEALLEVWGGALYAIDVWNRQDISDYPDTICNVNEDVHIQNYEITKSKLAKFGNRAVIMKYLSKDASTHFDDNSLDFVYIDANHSYEAVYSDMNIWHKKIKSGGLLCGDNYCNLSLDSLDYVLFEVEKAVNDFANDKGLHVNHTDDANERNRNWWIEL